MMKVLKKKRKGGFTLIELIVVIAILGILAAIAIPRLAGFRTTAQEGADKSSAAVIYRAWMLHESVNNGTDPDVDELNALLDDTLQLTAIGDVTVTQDAAGFITSLTYKGQKYPE